jgi:hypothetical protein
MMASSPARIRHDHYHDDPYPSAKLWRDAGQRETNARAKRESRQSHERFTMLQRQQTVHRRKQRQACQYYAHLVHVAQRLPAIIRDKHAGFLEAPAHYIALLLAQDGALKDPSWGRPAKRQQLVTDALDLAIWQGAIVRTQCDDSIVILSLGSQSPAYAHRTQNSRFAKELAHS